MADQGEAPTRLTDQRHELRADCGRCAGLSCVAPAFTRSADFAADKAAGRPCPNLRADFRCGIHQHLRDRGFPGCAVFDCFGAGQRVTQVTFGGRDWRSDAAIAPSMFAVFTVMRQLHEPLWYLREALALVPAGSLADELGRARERTTELARGGPGELACLDAAAYRRDVGGLLDRVSRMVRGTLGERAPDHRGADVIGANLRGSDLRGASLRGAYLLGADLRNADLREADLLGADLRAADLSGAKLTGSIFLTQPQLDAAIGDATTAIPTALRRPPHWPASARSTNPRPRRRR